MNQGPPDDGVVSAGPGDRTVPIEAAPSSSFRRRQAPAGDSSPAPSPEDKTIISKRPVASELPPPLPLPQQVGELLVGKRLEHYELDEFVGGGGMGAVFRATDTRLGRMVAVKVLLRDRADEETIRRFQNEAQNAARLDHPNIARVYYVGEDHGWNFIVFEFIEGTNLRDVVERNGPLDVEEALYYTLQVAEALAHSSSRDVVHRDIKPSNVLVTAENQIKLVDMGLARLHQVASSSDDLTASGVTLGTFDYISPEQARDPRSADVRSDIYSLGCTLHFMLTGQPPFPDGTALQKLIRHSSDEPPDVRVFRSDVPPQVAGVIAKMLAKRPAQRQASAEQLVAEILAVAEDLGFDRVVSHSALSLPRLARESGLWERAWQVIAAAAVLVAVIVLADSYFPSRTEVSGDRPPPKLAEPQIASLPAATSNEASGSAAVEGRQEARLGTAADREAALPAGGARLPASTAQVVSDNNAPPSSSLHTALAATDASGGLLPPADEGGAGPEPSGAEVAISENSAPAAASGVAAKPKRIIVAAAAPADLDPECEYVQTIHDACRRAAALALTDVEMRWNGPLHATALDIVSPRLFLRAGTGFKPILVFQPSVTERQMIRLSGGGTSRLAIQGVELRLELPKEPADGWSLIAMSSGQALELTDCVLTVQDGDVDRPAIHEQVAMISVLSRRVSDNMVMMDPQPMMSQSAAITLEQCIARGEATFVALADETPLTVRWNQGLLVTSQRLIETGGCATDPKWFEKIDIKLSSVTAICREGLHQMRRGSGKAYQLPLDVSAERCILATDPATPLFEFVGGPTIADDDLRLQSTGDSNCYPNADVVFLRVRSGVPGQREQDFELDDRRWSVENRSQVGNPWLHPPPRYVPAHAITKLDFTADPELAGGAGFDPLRLPAVAPSL